MLFKRDGGTKPRRSRRQFREEILALQRGARNSFYNRRRRCNAGRDRCIRRMHFTRAFAPAYARTCSLARIPRLRARTHREYESCFPTFSKHPSTRFRRTCRFSLIFHCLPPYRIACQFRSRILSVKEARSDPFSIVLLLFCSFARHVTLRRNAEIFIRKYKIQFYYFHYYIVTDSLLSDTSYFLFSYFSLVFDRLIFIFSQKRWSMIFLVCF